MRRVLIIIPCYNEEANVLQTISDLQENLSDTNDICFELLIVDDKSTDNTLKKVKEANINHLSLPINLGIGGAVQSGFIYAKKKQMDIAIQFDGDGQHKASFIPKLIHPIIHGEANIVIGSRFINTSNSTFRSTFLRRLGITYFSRLNKLLTGIVVHDSTSGFRALDKKAIDLVCEYYPENYPEPESIVLYHHFNLKINEIPVEMRAREGGKSSITGYKTLLYMYKVTLGTLILYIRLQSKAKK